MPRTTIVVLLLIASLLAVVPSDRAGAQDAGFEALLFSKTVSYRHDSIPAGIAMFEELAADEGFGLTATEDASVFSDQGLAQFDVVIMFQTSGPVWNDDQFAALQRYAEGGGGIVAIHNATDMNIEADYPWWDELLGATMTQHSAGNT